MFLDLSFEHDCAHEEYILDNITKISNGPKWVAYHTERGKEFLESMGWWGKIHERKLCAACLADRIRKEASRQRLSYTRGGFYWLNKEHTKHIGDE